MIPVFRAVGSVLANDPYKNMEYIRLIISQFDGPLRRQERQDMPYSLRGETPEQIAIAMKSRDYNDVALVKAYREWIDSVCRVEMDNRTNLQTLIFADWKAVHADRNDESRLIRAFLREEWEVDEKDLAEYATSSNKVKWIRIHANPTPGPSDAWRDPIGERRE